MFRVSYPAVIEPRLNKLNNTEEYSLQALFPKGADLSVLKVAIAAAATKKWGTDKKKWPDNLRNPLRDQAERAKKNDDGKMVMPVGHEEGAIFLTMKNKEPIGVVHTVAGRNVSITDKALVYAGCYARATVSFYGYDRLGNRGIACQLTAVQKMREGDPLVSRISAADSFAPNEEEGAAFGAPHESDLFS